MSSDACPSESLLLAFHSGQMQPDVMEFLGAHVEACTRCEGRLQALEAEVDSLVVELRQATKRASDLSEGLIRPRAAQTLSTLIDPLGPDAQARENDELGSTQPGVLAPTDANPGRGAVVRYFGDYEICEEIGRGGSGVVYHARQVSLNRSVALKMMRSGTLAGEDELRRFRNEAEAVALLDHPNIVPILEVGDHDGQRYLSMKYISGGNLADRLKSFHDAPRLVAALMNEVAGAVHYAHLRGVLHRDLKPANVLVDAMGRPHVTDFGLAKLVESPEEMTITGAILGTPAYMSPEQAGGHRGLITTATDVHGLGAILYTLLTGRAPFAEVGLIETLDAVKTTVAARPRKLNARVPRDLETICLKCLEKDPADRYPSADALAQDLRRFTAGEPVSVRPTGTLERAAKWARRKPTLAAAYALGFLAVTLGGLGALAARAWRSAEQARIVADTARSDAERSREEAEAARTVAFKASAEAQQLREQAEQIEYGRTMEVAHQEWRENRLSIARKLLEGTRADLRGWEWDFLNRLCHASQKTIKAGTPIRFAAFSPDGRRIVTAATGGTSYVWDTASGRKLLELKGPERAYWIGYSADGSRITARFNVNEFDGLGRALVWEAATGAVIFQQDDTYDSSWRYLGSSLSPDGTRIAVSRRTEQGLTHGVWDLAASDSPIWKAHHSQGVLSISFSPDGSRVLTGGRAGTAKIWDASTGADLLTLEVGTTPVHAIFTPDGRRILTCNNKPRWWDSATGIEIRALPVDWLSSVVLSRDGTRVAGVLANNHQAAVIDLETELSVILKGHTSKVTVVAFSPDGSRVVTASDDQTARVWDARTGRERNILRGHTSDVSSATFSPDGTTILTTGQDGEARIWDADRSDDEALIVGGTPGNNDIGQAIFSPDGSRLLTSGQYGRIWDARTGAPILTLKGWDNFLNKAAFFPDGRHVISGIRDYRAAVWDAETGHILTYLGDHKQSVEAAAVSGDGSRIATAGGDGVTRVYDSATGVFLHSLIGHSSGVATVEFSHDSSLLLTSSSDGTARIWNVRSGAQVSIVNAGPGTLVSARFSPDGSRIVTAGTASDEDLGFLARIWDVESGVLIHTLRGHTRPIMAAAFSPDGRRIVTAGWDRLVKLWDTASGVEVFSLKGHLGEVQSAEFSPDGTRIVSASRDGSARIWDSTPLNPEILARWPKPSTPKSPRPLADRLPAIYRGEAHPAHIAEHLAIALTAFGTGHFTVAARLWDEALVANPDLDRFVRLRFYVACAAAQTASGADKDDPTPDAAARSKLRHRAFHLLRIELDEMDAVPRSAPAKLHAQMAYDLRNWKQDASLASVRDPDVLNQLPAEDQTDWRALWSKVDSLLERHKDPKPE